MKRMRIGAAGVGGLALVAVGACADELSGVRAAASSGECLVKHEGHLEPAVALTAASYDLPTLDQQEVRDLLATFLAHGCSIEAPDRQGMSPVNVAVLLAEPDLLRYLLKAGADPTVRIAGSRPWANGKNSLEFAQKLDQVSPSAKRKQIIEILGSR